MYLLFCITIIYVISSDAAITNSVVRGTNSDFINCSCGRFQPERRLIDGASITDAEYPWLVGILKGNGPVGKPMCYGSLISDRHILTAASCVKAKKRYELSVYFYGGNVTKRRRRSVLDVDTHEDYAHVNHDNNLAVVTLAVPLELEKMRSEEISPICIPNPFLFAGRLNKMKGIMTKMQFSKTGMDRMQILVASPKFYFGSVPIKIHGIRNPTCSNIFSERVKEKTLCADLEGHCYGDEGSPLTITLSESGQTPVTTGGRYYLLGVYSKGYGCDGFQKGKSGVDVSTNIMNHTDWLIRRTRDGYFCSA